MYINRYIYHAKVIGLAPSHATPKFIIDQIYLLVVTTKVTMMKSLALYGLILAFFFLFGMPHYLLLICITTLLLSVIFFNDKILGCDNHHIGYTIKPWTPRIKLSLLYSLTFHMKHILDFMCWTLVLLSWSLLNSNSPWMNGPLMDRSHWG